MAYDNSDDNFSSAVREGLSAMFVFWGINFGNLIQLAI